MKFQQILINFGLRALTNFIEKVNFLTRNMIKNQIIKFQHILNKFVIRVDDF